MKRTQVDVSANEAKTMVFSGNDSFLLCHCFKKNVGKILTRRKKIKHSKTAQSFRNNVKMIHKIKPFKTPLTEEFRVETNWGKNWQYTLCNKVQLFVPFPCIFRGFQAFNIKQIVRKVVHLYKDNSA